MDSQDRYWIVKYRGYKKIDDIKLEMELIQKEYSRFLLCDILDKIDNIIKFKKNCDDGGDIILDVSDCIEDVLPPLIKIIKKNIC